MIKVERHYMLDIPAQHVLDAHEGKVRIFIEEDELAALIEAIIQGVNPSPGMIDTAANLRAQIAGEFNFEIALLNKIPSFNSEWTTEQKMSWFDALMAVMTSGESYDPKEPEPFPEPVAQAALAHQTGVTSPAPEFPIVIKSAPETRKTVGPAPFKVEYDEAADEVKYTPTEGPFVPLTPDEEEALAEWESRIPKDDLPGRQGSPLPEFSTAGSVPEPGTDKPGAEAPNAPQATAEAPVLPNGVSAKQYEKILHFWHAFVKDEMPIQKIPSLISSRVPGVNVAQVRAVLDAEEIFVPPAPSYAERGAKIRESLAKKREADAKLVAPPEPAPEKPEIFTDSRLDPGFASKFDDAKDLEGVRPTPSARPWDRPYSVNVGLEAIRMLRKGKSLGAIMQLKGIGPNEARSLQALAKDMTPGEYETLCDEWRGREEARRAA